MKKLAVQKQVFEAKKQCRKIENLYYGIFGAEKFISRLFGVFISHPIQYQAPLYQKLASKVNLKVFFYSNHGVKKSFDPQFGKSFKWDIPLLEGYNFEFLKKPKTCFSALKTINRFQHHSLFSGFHFFGFINFGIFREIRNSQFDAVLINSWSYLSDWFVVLAGVLNKTPIFLRAENPLSHEYTKVRWKIGLKKIILGKILFSRISKILYIGEENKKFYQFYGVPESKLIFTPYSVDNSRFVEAKRGLADKIYDFKNNLGIDRSSVVILFCGKLIKKKRPMDLLKAFQYISHRTSNSSLLFIGDGELKLQLEKYTKDNNLQNVYFVGFKNQTELPEYYSIADIFVLPSGVGETWGLVVNEAMCFGLPIIISDLVGCGTDLVKNGENGYIYPVGNIEKLSGYLNELVNNLEKRKKFGEQSFKIIQNYSYEKDIEGILKAMSNE